MPQKHLDIRENYALHMYVKCEMLCVYDAFVPPLYHVKCRQQAQLCGFSLFREDIRVYYLPKTKPFYMYILQYTIFVYSKQSSIRISSNPCSLWVNAGYDHLKCGNYVMYNLFKIECCSQPFQFSCVQSIQLEIGMAVFYYIV